MNKTRLLERIATDGHYLAGLIEDLRMAAALLTGEHPDFGELTRTKVGFRIARRLREVGQRLCDHARVTGDDTCRYCEAVVEEPQ
jgi:hypothetical protein